MREEVRCRECRRKTRVGMPYCAWCSAPLAEPAIAGEPADAEWGFPADEPADAGFPARFTVGALLAAVAAWLLTLNVLSGFDPPSSPDYETPGQVAGNVAILGPLIVVGVALVIWGIRLRRR